MSRKLERPAKELIVGAKYGYLVLTDGPRRNDRGSWEYKFRCEAPQRDGSICGKEKWIEKNRVTGKRSCGCMQGERVDLGGHITTTKQPIAEKEFPVIKPPKQKRPKIVFGEPIDFRGLRFAPVNEQGVVYLFGMVGQELGYLIESVRTNYPDCEGKRCFDKKNNKWEHIQIEFEYKSSHFQEHGHNPDQCGVIVCWEDDWKECPVEVLELRRVIKSLATDRTLYSSSLSRSIKEERRN